MCGQPMQIFKKMKTFAGSLSSSQVPTVQETRHPWQTALEMDSMWIQCSAAYNRLLLYSATPS